MKIEHLAINVEDPLAMGRWYVDHLGFKVKRRSVEPPYAHFLADDGCMDRELRDELRQAAQQWLEYYEDPYIFSAFDNNGKLGLDLGVYGAPETFVIDSKGIIRKRFAGAIDGNVWQREFEPLIRQLEQEAEIAKVP